MNRAPVYQDSDRRIISLPGNLWVVQERRDAKGTREFDPWEDRSHPLSYSKAMLELKQDKTGVTSGKQSKTS